MTITFGFVMLLLLFVVVIAILSGLGKPWPLWVAVLLLALIEVIDHAGGAAIR